MLSEPLSRFLPATFALLICLSLLACTPALYLKTTEAQPSEVTGTYSLILYGGRYSTDVENVAILAKEGAGYAFEVFAPDFDYRLRKHVPAEEALETALRFVGFHHAFRRSLLSAILDNKGAIIGYEVRPLYSPLDFGYSDVLDITYALQDSRVTVRVRLIRELDRTPFREDNPLFFRFMR